MRDREPYRNYCHIPVSHITDRLLGSTGLDLQKKLSSIGMDIPAIVISASDDEIVREYGRHVGAVAFFRKPVDDQALLDAILWAVAGARERVGQSKTMGN